MKHFHIFEERRVGALFSELVMAMSFGRKGIIYAKSMTISALNAGKMFIYWRRGACDTDSWMDVLNHAERLHTGC